MSNQTTYKPGNNQSGLNLPTHGEQAYAHSAAYIAMVCPADWASDNPAVHQAILNLRAAGKSLSDYFNAKHKESKHGQ